MKMVPKEDGFYVVSDSGQTVLGKFGTEQGALEFMNQYGALKQFSSVVDNVGMDAAMQQFLKRTRRGEQ